MIKLPDVVQEIVEKNPFLRFGLSNRILNLSQLAIFLRPFIQTRCKKEVTLSSITMNLSRIQQRYLKIHSNFPHFAIKNISIHSHLSAITIYKTAEVLHTVSEIILEVSKKKGYITVNQGTSEITLIIDQSSLPLLESHKKLQRKSETKNLGAISVHIETDYVDIPGFLHFIIQQITLQNINIVEISSTLSELIIYVDEKDIRLAFDTLHETVSM